MFFLVFSLKFFLITFKIFLRISWNLKCDWYNFEEIKKNSLNFEEENNRDKRMKI